MFKYRGTWNLFDFGTVKVYQHVVIRLRGRSVARDLLEDFASHFRCDCLSQDLRETRRVRRRELGVIEGRKPRSVRISSSKVNLDVNSRGQIKREKEDSET